MIMKYQAQVGDNITYSVRLFQLSGRKIPKPYVPLTSDETVTATAQSFGRLMGSVGQPVSPAGTVKVPFSSMGVARPNTTPSGRMDWIASKEQSTRA